MRGESPTSRNHALITTVLFMLVASGGVAHASATGIPRTGSSLSADGFNYVIDTDGDVVITGRTSSNAGPELVIPDLIAGLAVVAIGDWAFVGHGLASVVLPDSLVSIGKRAFGSNIITSVTIPKSVDHIADHAFWNNRITVVSFDGEVESIGDSAFANNGPNGDDSDWYVNGSENAMWGGGSSSGADYIRTSPDGESDDSGSSDDPEAPNNNDAGGGASIQLTMIDDSVSLNAMAGDSVNISNGMEYVVKTDNARGYSVYITADSPDLEPSSERNRDAISVESITVMQKSNGGSLSSDGELLLHQQSAGSNSGGDDFGVNFSLNVPFVASDTYTGSMTFTATVN